MGHVPEEGVEDVHQVSVASGRPSETDRRVDDQAILAPLAGDVYRHI